MVKKKAKGLAGEAWHAERLHAENEQGISVTTREAGSTEESPGSGPFSATGSKCPT